MTDELKPCPFCGSEKVLIASHVRPVPYTGMFETLHFGTCGNCGCAGTAAKSQEGATEYWNRRNIASLEAAAGVLHAAGWFVSPPFTDGMTEQERLRATHGDWSAVEEKHGPTVVVDGMYHQETGSFTLTCPFCMEVKWDVQTRTRHVCPNCQHTFIIKDAIGSRIIGGPSQVILHEVLP